ncbi:MAG: PAS domain-containing sensor histidine kinase [Lysobacterales bacterium]
MNSPRPGFRFSPAFVRSPDLVRRERYFFGLFRVFEAMLLVGISFSPLADQLVTLVAPEAAKVASILFLVAAGTLFVWEVHSAGTRALPTGVGLALDVLVGALALHATSGLDGGIASLLLINLAAGGVLLGPQLAFMFAAIAVSLQYFERSLSMMQDGEAERSLTEVSLFAVGYLAVTGLSQLLRQEVRLRQRLVEQRESDVESLSQLNDLIIRRMKSGVLVIEASGRILRINEAAWSLLGNPSPTRKEIADISPVLWERIQRWRASSRIEFEPVALVENGTEVVPRFVAVPQSAARSLIVFLEDTSQVTRQAEQLTLSSLGRLSASIAHEVRNPLAAISHAAQLLAESEQMPQADQRLLEIIRGQCLRMNAIVENILQLSRRERSKPELVNLTRWVGEFVDEFRGVQPLGADELRASMPEAAINVVFDADQLQQVAWNLTKNALRYGRMPDQPARISVTARRLPDSGQPVLEVIDRGPGVPEKLRPHVFDPFFTTSEFGTGLGLYIARQLCEANQATLELVQLAGGGACFRIQFHGQPESAGDNGQRA